MLINLFHRAVADLDKLTIINGADGTTEWDGENGRDIERYDLVNDAKSGTWNLVHTYTATNRDGGGDKVIAAIPKLEDAAVILRGLIEQDMKPRYAGILNELHGRKYWENDGETSIAAVERALKKRNSSAMFPDRK